MDNPTKVKTQIKATKTCILRVLVDVQSFKLVLRSVARGSVRVTKALRD